MNKEYYHNINEIQEYSELFTLQELEDILQTKPLDYDSYEYEKCEKEYGEIIDKQWIYRHAYLYQTQKDYLNNKYAQQGHNEYLNYCKQHNLDISKPITYDDIKQLIKRRIKLNALLNYELCMMDT